MLLPWREVGQGGRIVLDVRDTKKKLIPAVTPPVVCRWYAGDYSTATGPGDYLPFNSFSDALAATAGFGMPDLVLGSVDASWNQDGSADYVEIRYNSNILHLGWKWYIGIVENNLANSGVGSLPSAAAALAAAYAAKPNFLPASFCT